MQKQDTLPTASLRPLRQMADMILSLPEDRYAIAKASVELLAGLTVEGGPLTPGQLAERRAFLRQTADQKPGGCPEIETILERSEARP